MSDYLIPIVSVVLIWWASTGAVLWLARGLDRQMNVRLIIMTVLCGMGFAGVVISTAHHTQASVYLAFISAILIWGWVEFTLLSGMITGSTNEVCPEDISEFERFKLAFKTIEHHEYALVAMLIALAVLDSTSGSGMAIKTFALLWIMRLGAKLTIFSGAPELSTNMIPQRLSYMKSYFRHDRISVAFWLSLAGCTALLLTGLYALTNVQNDAVVQLQVTMLSTLVALAILEHIFMVLPIADSKLWGWALGKKSTRTQEQENTQIAAE
jgi:putative photosynthetic complex assembly protein 2